MRSFPSVTILLSAASLCAAPSGTFALRSPAIQRGNTYPTEFTCDGDSASPPLEWSGAPAGTKSFAVTMHHIPGPGDKHVYMVIYNIPAGTASLSRNSRNVGSWGINTVNGRPEYTPPCSQGPGLKTYTLTVYALSSEPKLAFPTAKVTMDMLVDAMKGKTLAISAMDVTYARSGNGGDRQGPGDRQGGGRPAAGGPRLPRELERALSTLNLSGAQKQKLDAAVQQYGDKQRQLREDFMKQLKSTLSAEDYAKVEEAMRQPPPPPGR